MRDLQEDFSERSRSLQLRLLSLVADPHFPVVRQHIHRGFPNRGTREVSQFVILSFIPCPRSNFEVQEGQFGIYNPSFPPNSRVRSGVIFLRCAR